MSKLPHPEPLSGASYSAAELTLDNRTVILLEQRRLPSDEIYVELKTVREVRDAIADMVVRGAPAIGIAAAYGLVLAAQQVDGVFLEHMQRAGQELNGARPTAVNLAWAVRRMLGAAQQLASRSASERVEELAAEARRIHVEDVAANREMGRLGAELIPDEAVILTHCNAGALATGGYGTALGVIRAAHDAGKKVRVLADETRPYLQGSRLTVWELHRDGVPVELITDASAASFFGRGEIDLAVVGSDRIAQNGDVANKIGTYSVACLAAAHERPFFVAAPWSTVDEECPSGGHIPIEERSSKEVTEMAGRTLAPAGVPVRNPAFDVTPAKLVTAIFTERGTIQPVGPEAIAALSPRAGA